MRKITWQIFEYEHRQKHQDWFWALGIVAVTSTVTAIIYKNYLLAILILLSSFLLAFLNLRKPEEINIEINEKGVRIEDDFYSYKNLKSFWINDNLLLIHSNRAFLPIITLTIRDRSPEEIKNFLKKYLPEEEIQEPWTTKLLEVLGI